MDIRSVINLIEQLEEQVLVEARHNDIFNDSYKSLVDKSESLDIKLNSTSTTKALADRIFSRDQFKRLPNTWKMYLSEVLVYEMFFLANEELEKESIDNQYIKKFIDTKLKKLQAKSYDVTPASVTVYGKLTHSIDIEYQKIKDLNPFELKSSFIAELDKLEKEYQDNNKLLSQLVDIDSEGTEIVLDLGEYVWVDLQKPYCDDEGEAMGHCGNTAAYKSGDTILSLRQKVTYNGEKYHRPVLTFILDERGFLGEMKGRKNNKPSDKYHSYIVELLKSPIVLGIKGGGHEPESNFSIDDLDQHYIDDIVSVKGEDFLKTKSPIADIAEEFKETGAFSTEMYRYLEEHLATGVTYDLDIRLEHYGDKLYLDLSDVIEEMPYIGYIRGEDHVDVHIEEDIDYDNYLSELSEENYDKVVQYLIDNHGDDIKELAEEDDEEYGELYIRENINRIIEELSVDAISDAVSTAVRYAFESGTTSEIYEAIESALNDIYYELDISNGKTVHELLDGDCEQEILPEDFEKFIENIIRLETIDVTDYFNEPRYGFHSFDSDYFKNEALIEQLKEHHVLE